MGWDPDALERLMSVADPVERPIVGGLCFGFGPITDRIDHAQAIIKKPFPTIFELRETDDDCGFRPRWAYVPNVLQRCDATGAAMLLIHRSVLERMATEAPGDWFDRVRHPKAKKLWGEDTSFCYRAGLLDIPVYVHAGVRTSHSKIVFVTETQFMNEIVAPPAEQRVDVIVPVLDRPQNAVPFMRSLRASTGLADAYAVCASDDSVSAAAWIAAGANVIIQDADRPGTFAAKVNDATRQTTAPFIFICGDDVTFHAGWLDQAVYVAELHGANVIGTNDLANARVMSGDHATHILIRRSYIDEVGASWDGPGVVCHEGYRHWFVDDEIVFAARQRGTFTSALGSYVPHHHPLFDETVEMDDTYRLGQRYTQADAKLFRRRLAISKAEVAA
jgi:GT2 family glycosyltransferase